MKPQKGFFYGWIIVGVGSLAYALAAGSYMAFGVFFKPVAADFGWDRATTAATFSLSLLAMGFASPLIGMLVDRYSTRYVAWGAGFLVGVGYVLLSQATALWHFYLLFPLVIGVGVEATLICVMAPVNRWFERRRGLAQGLVGAGSGIGTMAFPPLASFLILTAGWRQAYLVLGLLTGLLLVVLASWLKREPQEMGLAPYRGETLSKMAQPHPSPGEGFSFSQALATGTFWRLFLMDLLAILSYMFIMVHLVPYATDKGITPMAAAGLLSAFGATNTVGRVAWGAIADRIGRKLSLGLSLLLGALLIFSLLAPGGWWKLLFFAALFGFVQGGWIPNWMALQAEFFGLKSAGAMVGAMEAALCFGGAVGGYMAGYIFDVTGSYSGAFLMATLTLLASSGLAFSLKPPRRHR